MNKGLYTICLLGCGVAVAQSAADAKAAAKTVAFELISIRQDTTEREGTLGATADGFRMTNMTLSRLILTAYIPSDGGAVFWEPVGFPDWLRKERYDVEAKVSEADLAEWQKPARQQAMVRSMLQALLADRCHLAVHRELKDAPVYYLTVGKGGPKFKESKSDQLSPNGTQFPYPGGGTVELGADHEQHFSQAPMTLLASYLTNMNLGGRPVQDRTGLTGRYDFVLQWGWTGGMTAAPGEASDPGPTLFSATEALGLKLVPANGQVETLVLDHVERPTEN
jgi:uncharacterized protein (TIGR03435 family)